MLLFLKNRMSYSGKMLLDRFQRRVLGRVVPISQTWAQRPAEMDGMVSFLNWFDSTNSVEETVEAAHRDWNFRFRKQKYFPTSCKRRISLEIGFGGGRLMLAASKDFDEVYGVDIHNDFARTSAFLTSQGCEGFKLFHRDNIVEIESGSVDYVYSFIVFQHFDKVDEVNFYLEQIERLLSVEGVAHIYFGKTDAETIDVVDAKSFTLRDCSLFLNPETMKHLVETQFTMLDFETTLEKKSGSLAGESGQARIVFKKKEKMS